MALTTPDRVVQNRAFFNVGHLVPIILRYVEPRRKVSKDVSVFMDPIIWLLGYGKFCLAENKSLVELHTAAEHIQLAWQAKAACSFNIISF